MNLLKKIFLYGATLGSLFSGCDNKTNFVDETNWLKPPTKKENHLKENVSILSSEDLNKISDINSNKIYFSTPQDFSLGEILVGGISNKTPEGILRKVSKISIDKKEIQTTFASLEEIINSGEISVNKKLANTKSETKSELYNLHIPLDKIILEDLDGNLNTLEDQLSLSGDIYLNADYSINAKFNNKTNYLEFSTTIDQSSDFHIVGNFEKEIEKELNIYTLNFSPIAIPTSYGFPLIITPRLEVDVGVIGNVGLKKEYSLNESISFEGGIFYENGFWKNKREFNKNFSFESPTIEGNGKLTAYFSPEITFYLYGILGPNAKMTNSLTMEVDLVKNPWWEFYGENEISVGINSNVFSSIIPNYEKTLIKMQYPISQAKGYFEGINFSPEANFIISPEEGNVDTKFEFDASSTKDDHFQNEELFYRWDFDGDGDWDKNWKKGNTLESFVYNSSGLKYPKLQVKNSYEKIGECTKEIKVNNNEISYSSFKDPKDGQDYKIIQINGVWWFGENYNFYTKNSRYPKNDSLKNHSYGRLYDWHDASKICPEGWRIPSKEDWENMISYLENNIYEEGYGELLIEKKIGKILKEKGTAHWDPPNNSTDDIGFSAFGAGIHYFDEQTIFFRKTGFFWTSTPDYSENWEEHYGVMFSNDKETEEIYGRIDDYRISLRFVK